MNTLNQELTQLAIQLTGVAARNTVSLVRDRITVIKTKKDLEEQAIAYNSIINDLLADKEDLISIARNYKQELDQITISDEDIMHLHGTLQQMVRLLKEFSPTIDENQLQVFIQLVNQDTLKTMQLLGFNYKEAIGQPLTEICSDAIKSLSKKNVAAKKTR